MTPTETMLAKCEEWQAAYLEQITAGETDGFAWGQYTRLNTVVGYLEERKAR